MKKSYMLIGLVSCLLVTPVNADSMNGTYKGNPIVNVVVDDKPVLAEGDLPAFKLDGTTFVPIRVVAENLGATVEWDEKTQTAMIANPAKPQPKQQSDSDHPKDETDDDDNENNGKIDEDKKKLNPYSEMLNSVQKQVQATKVMHERMQLLYDLYMAEPSYKRTNDYWEQFIENDIPRQIDRVITLQQQLGELYNKKSISQDEQTDLNVFITKLRDAVNKYDAAASSFEQYMKNKETDDQRNTLLFIHDGFVLLASLEADIASELENHNAQTEEVKQND